MTSLHNHCTFCDGKSTLGEMLAAAKRAGISNFGMSCHSDDPRPFNTRPEVEREYIDLINAAKKTALVNLLLGVEDDFFFPVSFRDEYDYIIGSVHYVEADGKLYAVDNSADEVRQCIEKCGSDMDFVERYYRTVAECAKKAPDVLGHFDVFRKRAAGLIDFTSKKYLDLSLDALDECLKTDVVFELNYNGLFKKYVDYPYPERFILERIRDKGGRVVVSVDCHNADFIDFGLREGKKLLKELNFTSVTEWRDGGLTDVKL